LLELLGKYQDRKMDLADACLVRMTELERAAVVFTLDREDFTVYRKRGKQPGSSGRESAPTNLQPPLWFPERGFLFPSSTVAAGGCCINFGGARLLTSRLAGTLAPPKDQIDTIPAGVSPLQSCSLKNGSS